MHHLGPNMKLLREMHGKTLEEVSLRIRCSKSALSRMERGERGITEHILQDWLWLFFITENALRDAPEIAKRHLNGAKKDADQTTGA